MKCSVDGCDNTGKLVRTWCLKHYERWRQHGDTSIVRTRRPAFSAEPNRFLARIAVDPSGCWIWTGNLSATGYGRFKPSGVGSTVAHRYFYEQVYGVLPEGLELDHLCRVRSCVNPSHLEPVTHAENMRRSIPHNRLKTTCPQGHPYAGDNLWLSTQGGGKHQMRVCRACSREAHRRRAAERQT